LIRDELVARIHREGPIPFDAFMEAALYGEGGFFASARGAGRAGRDFITSPEVGSLFGACVARGLAEYWRNAGEPDPFLVVEAGAGNGRLAADILRARPDFASALRYVLVERSPSLRAEQRTRLPIDPPDEALGPYVRRQGSDAPEPARRAGPVVAALDDLPPIEARDGVVVANELLDNLPFGIAELTDAGWHEVRVAYERDHFVELLVPAPDVSTLDVPVGARVPIPRGLDRWFEECDRVLASGLVILIDYMVDARELARRRWLRTYRGHERGIDPLRDPGSADITGDVVVEQLVAAASGFRLVRHTTQAAWLTDLGIDEMVSEGRRRWDEGAPRGDLEALAGRSSVNEAAALTDPNGLGAHHVVVLERVLGGQPRG
jgi:SAM-dependent MidA family methyltransferase